MRFTFFDNCIGKIFGKDILVLIFKHQFQSGDFQWLRLHIPNAGGLGSIPGQGTRSHMINHSQINKFFFTVQKDVTVI